MLITATFLPLESTSSAGQNNEWWSFTLEGIETRHIWKILKKSVRDLHNTLTLLASEISSDDQEPMLQSAAILTICSTLAFIFVKLRRYYDGLECRVVAQL